RALAQLNARTDAAVGPAPDPSSAAPNTPCIFGPRGSLPRMRAPPGLLPGRGGTVNRLKSWLAGAALVATVCIPVGPVHADGPLTAGPRLPMLPPDQANNVGQPAKFGGTLAVSVPCLGGDGYLDTLFVAET